MLIQYSRVTQKCKTDVSRPYFVAASTVMVHLSTSEQYFLFFKKKIHKYDIIEYI